MSSIPKYELIVNELLNKIQRGEYSYETPICTEKQLCADYNVSRITAKRAITELEVRGLLSRKRGVGSFVVRNSASNLDTTDKNSVAIDTRTIAFLLPFEIDKGGILSVVTAANRLLNQKGYFLSVHVSNAFQSKTKEKKNIQRLLLQNLSGLVYYPVRDELHLELLNQFVYEEKPVVVIDKDVSCPYINNVTADNFDGGIQLTNHLISLGHSNISFITTAALESTSSVQNRFAGFLNTLRTNRIKPLPHNYLLFPHELDYNKRKSGEHDLFKKHLQQQYNAGVTAFICENDQVAYYTLKACEDIGLSVPNQISICGFDNSDWAIMDDIGITTISQNFSQIGESVAEILLHSLTDPLAEIQKIAIPVELIVRESTAPPRL